MKGIFQSSTILFASIIAVGACSKSSKTDRVAEVAQDTMLMHDLAEANRNTAAAAASDTTMAVVHSGAGPSALLSGASASSPVTQPVPSTSLTQPSTTAPLAGSPRMSAPTRANDAPAPTNVTRRMTSAGDAEARSTGNPCDSPNPADQRTCLNRSIVANDADLNSTYRDLIAQAQRSGGNDLEERFRQSQRDWINRRDVGCRDRGSGALWARERAQCLADYSERRTAELRQSLNSLRGQQ